jgi:hypothetical protein
MEKSAKSRKYPQNKPLRRPLRASKSTTLLFSIGYTRIIMQKKAIDNKEVTENVFSEGYWVGKTTFLDVFACWPDK